MVIEKCAFLQMPCGILTFLAPRDFCIIWQLVIVSVEEKSPVNAEKHGNCSYTTDTDDAS